MRTYEDYYTSSMVRGQDVTKGTPSVIAVNIYFGIRLQATFMANQGFYKILGFMTMEEILETYREAECGYPGPLKINTQSDLARLGVVRKLAFTLIPSDPTKTIPPYGAKSKTAVP